MHDSEQKQPNQLEQNSPELPSVGSLIAGKYQIVETLGFGGMGTVYKVEQVFLNSIHALKVLTVIDSTSLIRFHKEARISFRLQHPNLVAVTELGVLDSGMPFLVMDYVEGVSLSQLLRDRGRLPWPEALDIFIQLCDGLAFAHEKGIIHRDLKPSNFMLCNAGTNPAETQKQIGSRQAKIIDFGIAKALEDGSSDNQFHTKTGEIFGSPMYMSPEQTSGAKLDERSDIYSLGCALFETVTGKPPFVAETSLHTMMMHQTKQAPALSSMVSLQFPEKLERLVAQLLSKDPAMRIQTANRVKQRLVDIKNDNQDEPNRITGLTWFSNIPVATRKRLLIYSSCGISLLLFVGVVTRALIVAFTPEQPSKPISIYLGNTAKHAKHEKPSTPPIDNKPFAKLTAAQALATKQPWVFDFPEDVCLGSIYNSVTSRNGIQHPVGKSYSAQGRVILQPNQPVTFRPDDPINKQPGFYSKFHADDLYEIESVPANSLLSDADMVYLGHLTGLRILKTKDGTLSDKGLMAVGNLPNLNRLIVDQCAVTGAGLARMPNLRQLVELKADSITHGASVMDGLAGSTNLSTFRMRNGELTDAEMIRLASCPKLFEVGVSDNPGITDAGIKALAKAPLLWALEIRGTSVTSSCLHYITQMVKLKRLAIDCNTWPAQERAPLLEYCKNKGIELNKYDNYRSKKPAQSGSLP